ncbi:uncharacterized protein LOC132791221 [Drosophila nasuta]|uniref:uncharacterized protein LOC132791221 n=1 Tax=Drosophila nasuta TaxID=42062 RepID=UPI00295E76AC|nr:uncharacterized protein LOC132791221 [Drosophila nasuta]
MPPQRSCVLRLLCLLLLLQHSLSIRIEDKSRSSSRATSSRGTSTTSSTTSTVTPPVYRVSRPEPKQPAKRVPPHLQDVRPGYVDDDAGDVIRIIEPPAHFQELKRLRQRQSQRNAPQKAVVWEQPRKLSTNRQPRPKLQQTQPQSHIQPHGQPHLQPLSQSKSQAHSGDLLTQEAQFAPQIVNNLQLPMEILASVRKTERILQRQRQKLPLVRQRHIQRQSHTMIAQKSLEQQLYQRGQQQRLRAVLNDDHKRSKRVKREANPAGYDVAQGLKLVAHIGELLNSASQYLPDELEPNELAPQASPLTAALESMESQSCGNSTKCDSRRRRQRLFKLQGSKKTAARGRNFRHEASTTTTTTTTTTTAKSTTTSTSTTSATPLASRLVNSRKSPNNRNQQQQQQQQQLQLPASPRSDDTVLYADVMSNIRNLWQEHDYDHDLSHSLAPQFVAPEQVANNSDYRALQVYLRELDEISKRLPTVASLTSLNHQEFARSTPSPSWYLINNEGKIYETHLDSETKPTAALFHTFPDMPEDNDAVLTQNLE